MRHAGEGCQVRRRGCQEQLGFNIVILLDNWYVLYTGLKQQFMAFIACLLHVSWRSRSIATGCTTLAQNVTELVNSTGLTTGPDPRPVPGPWLSRNRAGNLQLTCGSRSMGSPPLNIYRKHKNELNFAQIWLYLAQEHSTTHINDTIFKPWIHRIDKYIIHFYQGDRYVTINYSQVISDPQVTDLHKEVPQIFIQ